MRERRWIWVTTGLFGVAVLTLGVQWFRERLSLRSRFERVAAGMSEVEVMSVMGASEDLRSDRLHPQVSQYAEVWQVVGGAFARREYRGLDVHTQVHFSGQRYSVWKADEAVVVIEYDGAGRVCGKIRLTE
jgi:hypothetical protein